MDSQTIPDPCLGFSPQANSVYVDAYVMVKPLEVRAAMRSCMKAAMREVLLQTLLGPFSLLPAALAGPMARHATVVSIGDGGHHPGDRRRQSGITVRLALH